MSGKRALSIIGLDGSANGVDATPARTVAAPIVVQHVAPCQNLTFRGMLQTQTDMPVARINTGTKTQPDRIDILPADTIACLDGNRLHSTKHENYMARLDKDGPANMLQPDVERPLPRIQARSNNVIGHEFPNFEPATRIRKIKRCMRVFRISGENQFITMLDHKTQAHNLAQLS